MTQIFYLDGTPSREIVEDYVPTKSDRLTAAIAIVDGIETLGSCEGDNALHDAAKALRRAMEILFRTNRP